MIQCQFENGRHANLRHVSVGVITLNDNKKEILLIKRAAHLVNGNKYALPGGILDFNETTSQGALRELKEETGYEGEITSLFRIVDSPNRLNEERRMVDFIFTVAVGKQIGKPDGEATEVKWFDLNSLPPRDQFAFDHFENIQLYLQHLKKPFTLPIFNL
jgi:ADP-ribose pyrophosphatase YjhB (NUDIX family)